MNAEEAKHASVFVAGWRSAIGWACAAAYAYHFVVQPFLAFGLSAFGVNTDTDTDTPDLDVGELSFGMLGLGGMRTFEKIKGVAR